MKKKAWELTTEEMTERMQEAAKRAIAETHAVGRPSTHGDNKGVYHLYPDGRKEYVEVYGDEKQ